jgi:hypothetical protein
LVVAAVADGFPAGVAGLDWSATAGSVTSRRLAMRVRKQDFKLVNFIVVLLGIVFTCAL